MIRVQNGVIAQIGRARMCAPLNLFGLAFLCAVALLSGCASADIATLVRGCFATIEAQDASAFPQKIKQVSRNPDQFMQTYKTNDGVMSVLMIDNKDQPSLVCQIDGVERKDPLKAERISVLWPAVSDKMDALFRAYAKKPGFKIIDGRLKEDSLGVNYLLAVKCSAPTATISFGPSRLSDAGFLTPPFAMSALNEATFTVQMNRPMFGGMVKKHCK